MFFARIIVFFVFLGFLYLLWWKVIKPLLENHGIKCDEEEIIETDHTKRLDKTKQVHAEMTKSAEAVQTELELKKEMSKAEDVIEKTEKKIKKI